MSVFRNWMFEDLPMYTSKQRNIFVLDPHAIRVCGHGDELGVDVEDDDAFDDDNDSAADNDVVDVDDDADNN